MFLYLRLTLALGIQKKINKLALVLENYSFVKEFLK